MSTAGKNASTRMMRTCYSTKPCLETAKSQISHAVVDSTWEHYTAQVLEQCSDVSAYAKSAAPSEPIGEGVLVMARP